MIELLREAAHELPDHLAIITPSRSLTFAEVLTDAETAAAALLARGITRFAVLDDDAATVWSLLAASSLSGAEICVYPIAATDEVIEELRTRLEHDVIVTSRDLVGNGVLASSDLLGGTDRHLGDPPSGSRPLLVLTTGTSGHPQAAQNEWRRVMRQAERIEPTPEHRWLLAYGLNQFGGLQILIHVTAARATLITAESFQPRDALAVMREHHVTHASGTPTFWRFILAEMRADKGPTPELSQVTLSGEAVPSALLEQLKETFPTARISQIFGATEMGQTLTVRDGLAGLPLSVLEEGGDVVFKIVEDELWVRTRSSMLGYYNQDRLGEDAWRGTGDLVEVIDGRIQFRGRKSEVINVGGVKVHPLPIEERVSQIKGVALVHAYGRPSKMVGHIVALDVVAVEGADEEQLRAEIREATADMPPASRPRSIKFVTTMDTAGNKLRRGQRT
jgi:acyl-CoA synthetase (AMP-forming)/AMP-acid ligase II